MALKREHASGSELGEVLTLESSVLRTLCLTINATGSELKDKILDTLSAEDFYFPVNQSLFAILMDMNLRGDYVVCSNLGDELHKRGVGLPEGLFLEDLFRGDLPKLPEVAEWVGRLKDRAAKRPSAVLPGSTEAAAKAGPVAEGPPTIPRKAEAVLPSPGGRTSDGIAAAGKGTIAPPASSQEIRRGPDEPERQSRTRVVRTGATEEPGRQGAPSVLPSEGEEWANYLRELAAKQGKRFETGFAGLDETAGVFPGLMLLGDQNAGRLTGFLKQLTDQVAARSKVPCLYLAFEVPKAALRLRTLARLSGVPARDLERGRIKRGSPEWENVERHGREAAEWLKWVFVVEADRGMEASRIRDTGRRLLESFGAATCLVVVDTLERLGARGEPLEAVVAELKGLSESLDALVVGATTSSDLPAEREADYVARVRESQTAGIQLEVLRREDSRAITLRFEYQPEISRFVEHTSA